MSGDGVNIPVAIEVDPRSKVQLDEVGKSLSGVEREMLALGTAAGANAPAIQRFLENLGGKSAEEIRGGLLAALRETYGELPKTAAELRAAAAEAEKLAASERELAETFGLATHGAQDQTAAAAGLGTSWTEVKSALDLAGAGFHQLRAFAASVAALSAEQQHLDANMSRLGLDFNAAAAAAGRFTDEVDVMHAANALASAGFHATQTQLEDITRRAALYSQELGVGMPEALDKLVNGLITGNARGLRPFGGALVDAGGAAHTMSERLAALHADVERLPPATDDATSSLERLKDQGEDALRALAAGFVEGVTQAGLFSGAASALEGVLLSTNSALGSVGLALGTVDDQTGALTIHWREMGTAFASTLAMIAHGAGTVLAAGGTAVSMGANALRDAGEIVTGQGFQDHTGAARREGWAATAAQGRSFLEFFTGDAAARQQAETAARQAEAARNAEARRAAADEMAAQERGAAMRATAEAAATRERTTRERAAQAALTRRLEDAARAGGTRAAGIADASGRHVSAETRRELERTFGGLNADAVAHEVDQLERALEQGAHRVAGARRRAHREVADSVPEDMREAQLQANAAGAAQMADAEARRRTDAAMRGDIAGKVRAGVQQTNVDADRDAAQESEKAAQAAATGKAEAAAAAVAQAETLAGRLEAVWGRTTSAAQHAADAISGAFQAAGAAIGKHIEAVVLGKESLADALQGMLSDTLAAIAKESAVKAGLELAGAAASAAMFNFPAAALHLAAAAAYTGVAALAGAGAVATAPSAAASPAAAGAQRPLDAGGRGANDNARGGSVTIVRNYYAPSFGGREGTRAEAGRVMQAEYLEEADRRAAGGRGRD